MPLHQALQSLKLESGANSQQGLELGKRVREERKERREKERERERDERIGEER